MIERNERGGTDGRRGGSLGAGDVGERVEVDVADAGDDEGSEILSIDVRSVLTDISRKGKLTYTIGKTIKAQAGIF